MPTDKRCIKGEGLYNRLRFHSFPEILIKYNINDFIEKESQKRQAGKSRFNRTLKFEDASIGRNLKTKRSV